MDKTFIKDFKNMYWRIRVRQCTLILDAISEIPGQVFDWSKIIDDGMYLKMEVLDITCSRILEYLELEASKITGPEGDSFLEISERPEILEMDSQDKKWLEDYFINQRHLFKEQINN